MLRDGYYNYSDDPHDSECWRVAGENVYFVRANGEERRSSTTLGTLSNGDYVPSQWLPPGVTHNPALGPAVNPTPGPNDDVEAARRWITKQAAVLIPKIICDLTPMAPEDVRNVYPQPSRIDRAIAERVLELLS